MADPIRSGALVTALILATAATARAQIAPPPPAPPAEAEVPTVAADVPAPQRGVVYGAGLRARYVSVPGWFLGLFTKQNVPLSAYGLGGEFFRRKGELDISFGLSWQKMGPPDGNWLGKGKRAEIDTDFVQFRGFGLVGADASFIWRTALSEHVAFRYGAGLGIAIVTGHMYRTSAAGCTEVNAGNERECYPRLPGCTADGCTEKALKDSEGRPDNGPGDPHRFIEDDVPGAIPIVNMMLGFDFRIPDVQGLEFRLEGGFFNAFVLGLGAAYAF